MLYIVKKPLMCKGGFIMEQIIAVGLKESVYLGLSLFLIFWILKENQKREKEMREDINQREQEFKKLLAETNQMITKNQEIIKELTEKLEVVNAIKNDVQEIKININSKR
jgi:uncharacterized protein YoxC